MGKKSRFLHIEILIWIIVVLLIILGGTTCYRNSLKQYETHKIFMEDIDGLIVGSPVKLMGVQVGYINRIRIVGDSVYLKFIIKDKDVHLPWGTVATVEFSGMAGSRSLELYPPNSVADGENVDYIKVVNPTRLSQSLSLLYEMYHKFMDICYGLSNFGNQLERINFHINSQEFSNLHFEKFLEFTDCWLDNSNNKIFDFTKKYRKEK